MADADTVAQFSLCGLDCPLRGHVAVQGGQADCKCPQLHGQS